ncbi:MAG: ABC transporter permease, partial [Gemmatimonadetes bacterium]|nr:ABC transporter permease [Gemmatimonadota bacterium]
MTRYADRPLSLAVRSYRGLLPVLPRDFRHHYGSDMVETFREMINEARLRGAFAVAALWLTAVWRLLSVSVGEHWDAFKNNWSPVGNESDPHDRGGSEPMNRVFNELRQAARSYRKRPGFALTALLLIAVGVGATTTIFSVVDGVLLRQLPYPGQDRLIFFTDPSHSGVSYRAWQQRTSAYEAMTAVDPRDVDLTGTGRPERLTGAAIDPGFFGLFGAQPAYGRLLGGDDFSGGAPVAVLSHRFWQRRFGGDPNVVGSTLSLNGAPTVVVGILSARFDEPEAMIDRGTEVYFPLEMTGERFEHPGYHVLRVAARLRPDVTMAQAQAELDGVASAMAEENPDYYRSRDGNPRPMGIASLREVTSQDVSGTLLMLLGAVGLMLAIACANVANLFLARGTDRMREMAVRAALGASRRRLVSQLITESALLSVVGGLLGVGLAYLGVRAFVMLSPGDIPMMHRVGVDLRVLGFAVGISLLSGILFGVAPAWQAIRVPVTESLKDSGNASAGRRKARLRHTLVVAEIALALVLLTGAGLLFNSFVRLQSVDPGFDAEGVVVFPLILDDQRYDEEARTQFSRLTLERVRDLPGVTHAAVAVVTPFLYYGSTHCCYQTSRFSVDGEEVDVRASVQPVTDSYFELLGATITGREFTASDAGRSPWPVVVTEQMALDLFGTTDVINRTFELRDDEVMIVGVVSGLHAWGLDQGTRTEMYVPFENLGTGFSEFALMVRTAQHPSAAIPSIRQAIWQLEPDLPIDEPYIMTSRIAESLTTPRFLTAMMLTFAAVAILLAAGGIYGSMLYSVGQRRRELGIRMALGAGRGKVLGMVVGQGAKLALIGIALGIAGSLAVTRFLSAMVYGISTTDAPTFALVAILLGSVA